MAKTYLQNKHKTATATLTAAGWDTSKYLQRVSVDGITATNTVILAPSDDTYVDYGKAHVRCISQTTNALTFLCEKIPTTSLTVNVVIME